MTDPTELDPRLIRARRKYHAAALTLVACGVIATLAFSAIMLFLTVKTADTSDAVADCLTPGGGCYERAQLRTEIVTVNAHNIRALCKALEADCTDLPDLPQEEP